MKDLTPIYRNGFKKSIIKSYLFFQKRLTHPYNVLSESFNAGSIAGHLKIVKQLFNNTTIEICIAKGPNSMIHGHQLFSMLLNAIWLIEKTKVKYIAMPFQIELVVISVGNLRHRCLQQIFNAEPI